MADLFTGGEVNRLENGRRPKPRVKGWPSTEAVKWTVLFEIWTDFSV